MMRRRGIGSFCHGDASTSTLQHQVHGKDLPPGSSGAADAASSSFLTVPPSVVGSSCVAESEAMSGVCAGPSPPDQPAAVTLEQMILQLDLEEEAARKAKRRAAMAEEEDGGWCPPRRMSCVDGDHVVRSARDALSQYPRFSLDGRDAMYRASFSGSGFYYDGVGGHGAASGGGGHHRPTARASSAAACCAAGGAECGALACAAGYEMDLERTLRMPATVAGESVVWCKPGVVAKLMGLDAVPVPVRGAGLRRRKASGGPPPAATCAGAGGIRKQRLRRTAGQEELAFQKERLFMALHGYDVAERGHATLAPVGPTPVGLAGTAMTGSLGCAVDRRPINVRR